MKGNGTLWALSSSWLKQPIGSPRRLQLQMTPPIFLFANNTQFSVYYVLQLYLEEVRLSPAMVLFGFWGRYSDIAACLGKMQAKKKNKERVKKIIISYYWMPLNVTHNQLNFFMAEERCCPSLDDTLTQTNKKTQGYFQHFSVTGIWHASVSLPVGPTQQLAELYTVFFIYAIVFTCT